MGILEDDFSDIIEKAREGLGLTTAELARRSGLSDAELRKLASGVPPAPEQIRAIAKALQLDAGRLEAIAFGRWRPAETSPEVRAYVEVLDGSVGGYGVHGYVLHDPETKEAAVFDTAHDAAIVLAALRKLDVQARYILLTHSHYDHVEGVDQLREATGVTVAIHRDEIPLYRRLAKGPPDRLLSEGETIELGSLQIRALSTPGHTPGGLSYFVTGPRFCACFVGDALFAGSTGRSLSPGGYRTLLDSLRAKVLTLPGDTAIFPGHGPATTVAEERVHNPFF